MAYVLVVDDEPDGREALCRYLSKAGHEVACASNGREALKSILARIPDVTILDLFMPNMDGLALLEVLRSYTRLQPLPVIILTGFPESATLTRARQLQVSAILPKAKVTLHEILQIVNAELSQGGSPPAPPDSTYYFTDQ